LKKIDALLARVKPDTDCLPRALLTYADGSTRELDVLEAVLETLPGDKGELPEQTERPVSMASRGNGNGLLADLAAQLLDCEVVPWPSGAR